MDMRSVEKSSPKTNDLCCEICGVPLCGECEMIKLCSSYAELWESEMDLENIEAEEES